MSLAGVKKTLRKERLEPINQEFRNSGIQNPLNNFPTKHDTIVKALFAVETNRIKSNKRTLQDNLRWLHADRIDANFGLHGESQSDTIRRAYRRVESSALFAPTNAKDAPLSEIVPSNATAGKRFVVVEESRLRELTKLEDTLRKEKELLGEQCGWALNDMEVNARIPMPAIRLAVHNLCQQQMLAVAEDVKRLKEQWEAFCRQNHYHKPHLFIKDSYINTAPLSQRALKLRLVREAVETWRLRKDRDTMAFEDDLSYLMGKYHAARIRQQDYERYYILAARYGPFSDQEFNRDSRPGKRYFIAASRGAIKLQLLWDRYWAMTKLRRYRAARTIQKHYRCRYYYRKYHPIIRLRLRIGKKTYLIYCWHAWLHYNHLCRQIKDALEYQFNTFIKNNFIAWRRFAKEAKAGRELRAQTMIGRATNAIVYFKFKAWCRFTNGQRNMKIRLRRHNGFPHFDVWVQHVKWLKHLKKVNLSASRVQALFRMVLARRRFLRKKRAQLKLVEFSKIVLCVRHVRRLRRATVLQEFEQWAPSESSRRHNRANETEKQRLVKRQQFVAEMEKGALAGLKKHLNSKDGHLNLDHIMKLPETAEQMAARYPAKNYATLPKDGKYKLIAKSLREELCRVIRLLEAHNYNAKHPPFIRCADVHCGATCTSEQQYLTHLKESPPHNGHSPQFAEFHLLLRHQRGHELLRTYLTRLHGIAGLVQYLDAYFAIQEWKKLQTSSESYEGKALTILELYLLPDSPRKLDLSFPEASAMVETLNTVKNKEHTGLYRRTRAPPGFVRGLLGVAGPEYFEFTTEGVLPPDVFQHLEWHCFQVLFKAVDQDMRFKASAEHATYLQLLDEEREHRHEEFVKEYEKYRLMTIRQWTGSFCDHERAMYLKASEIVEVFMRREVEYLYKQTERTEVHRRRVEIRHAEQAAHEAEMLLTEDVCSWVEEDTLESVYAYYVGSLVDRMLEVPELRKGVLQYGGLMKGHARHMQITPTLTGGKDEWFKDFYRDARRREGGGAIPPGGEDAVVVIQRRLRGVLGRKKARRVFMQLYVKLYDAQSGSPYYHNVRTGESSWERPLMTRHLYHRSNW